MRWLYSALLYLITPLVLIRLLLRGRKAPDYLRRWGERFARYEGEAAEGVIWFHAVSVGEAEAVFPLVRAVRQTFPEKPVLITTTTPTGSGRVTAVFGDSVEHVYLPYDLPGCIERFLRRFRPMLAVIMETEIWPNLFRGCARNGIPLAIVNARLSAKSARGYGKLRAFTKDVLADVTLIAAQTETDAERFREIGALPEKVRVAGNIKFDLQLRDDLADQARMLRNDRFGDRPVWICASTHEGEEEKLLDVFRRVRKTCPDLLLVLVPRHPERFDQVAALCLERGLAGVLHSEQRPCDAGTEVFIVDAMGVLRLYLAASDVAFVGGSLVPTGGHNILEPAAVGIPVLFGPHMFNFEKIAQQLVEAGAARQHAEITHLAEDLTRILTHSDLREDMGRKGREFVKGNRGALGRVVKILEGVLRPT
ncbi:MAG: lipid IV(A) 3-deoxy-D-manno-octulosonic acid transferase [Pseudomonadota bacterium]